jgi:uncharacterized protein YraI
VSHSDRIATSDNHLTARTLARGLNFSERPKWLMPSLMIALWLTSLYVTGTLLFTNAPNLFGGKERQKAESEVTLALKPSPKIASVDLKAIEGGEGQLRSIADRPHAVSPDQASYEAPALLSPAPVQQEDQSPSPSKPPEEAAGQSAELLKVTANALIRSGPSTRARKIGSATRGVTLEVKTRAGSWVEVVESSSGRLGWIHSSLVAPASGTGAISAAATQADRTSIAPPKPKVAKKRIKKPSAAAQARLPRPGPSAPTRAYADLPHDEEFLPLKRTGPKRRQLREGLTSPGFAPP